MRRIAILLLAAVLTLSCVGCAAPAQTQPEETGPTETAEAVSWDGLRLDQPETLAYATEFSISENEEGYQKITVGTDQTILVVPEGAQTPEGIPENVTVLHQPLQNIYMVASARDSW